MATAIETAKIICAELINSGVRDFVLAPGSRNAPFGFAAFAAEQRGEIRLHVRIDERSAGFTALGLSVGTDSPVVVITTSGTAVANLHPAVLEAAHAGRPLIVISADRPATLIGSGANQTTVQQGIFGAALRGIWQLADADDQPEHWRSAVRRAVVAATGVRDRSPGPVQLNVALRPPLVPGAADHDPVDAGRFEGQSLPPPVPAAVDVAARSVVVAGDASAPTGRQAVELAQATGLPLLAEPSSNARRGPAIGTYRLLLPGFAPEIEQVICFGHPTLSRPVQQLLARTDLELIMVTETAQWIDPGLAVDRVVDAVQPRGQGDPQWLARWQGADRELRRRITAEESAAGTELGGARTASIFWSVLAGLAEEQLVVLGSSQLIRDVDLAPVGPHAPRVHANRGLAGIDGTVSTAVGLALGAGHAVHALLGDLTFLHDLNGLLIGPEEPRPEVRFVVVNDDGGAIFGTLEQGAVEHADAFERIFGAPHGSGLAQLVEGYRARYRRVDTATDLAAELRRPVHGIEVLEVVVDRSERRAEQQRLQDLGAQITLSAN
ncbi:2-succinyl-5-enolpyruvyl-6-hydroxy-3-cyclohexene-1-carboxylic-acid synthase [Naumannella halotolerans]|uniref:2-succinyl-5-enolpyruvyl-6-hydroxy-3-cyclohexene-1-carboxylate synthase n=1 Tax=Naumannella halotolerans TaxID=993414 RepID=A0A4R7JA73_9ACTN|nr:2-succinyl-5-enolpyruvyl-6-hydroxy-3-cyclohexene-1-carboxylic-acid synthase [Naumannella halotolerans]TDT34462.1 2-succinyl-5-enolpyruvyl-6-hydroxy-3-cyclohexene-1-carboxylate synthase [Naumannella halotolerans]